MYMIIKLTKQTQEITKFKKGFPPKGMNTNQMVTTIRVKPAKLAYM